MKPYFLIVILVSLFHFPMANAQENGMFKPSLITNTTAEKEEIPALTDAFINFDYVTPLLERENKEDMCDYYKNNMDAVATNRLGEPSKLLVLDEHYLKLEVSPNHLVEVRNYLDHRKVTFADTTVAAPYYLNVVLSTVSVPAADSEIAVYDVLGQKLETAQFIKLPGIEDFFNVKSKKDKKRILSFIEFPLIQYEFTSEGDLVAKTTIADYMSEEQFKEVEHYIIPKLVYKWNADKTRFELLKN